MYKSEHKISGGAGNIERRHDRRSNMVQHWSSTSACVHLTNFSAYTNPVETQEHKYSNLFTCETLTQEVNSLHGSLFTPDDALFSQSFDVSATCWSSQLCFYSLGQPVSCLSDGPVLLGLPASLSSSSWWWNCWVTQLGSGSWRRKGEKKINVAGLTGAGGQKADKLMYTAMMSPLYCYSL